MTTLLSPPGQIERLSWDAESGELPIQFARVNRSVVPVGSEPSDTFIDDVMDAFSRSGYALILDDTTWLLGGLEDVEYEGRRYVQGHYGRVYARRQDQAYDSVLTQWRPDFTPIGDEAVTAFMLDADSQFLAVAAYGGELDLEDFVAAFSRILTEGSRERPELRWYCVPVTTSGAFTRWMQDVGRITEISFTLWLPNPRLDETLAPYVTVLAESAADTAELKLITTGPETLRPTESSFVASAIEAVKRFFGRIRASGRNQLGEVIPFSERDHYVTRRDTVPQADAKSVPPRLAEALNKESLEKDSA